MTQYKNRKKLNIRFFYWLVVVPLLPSKPSKPSSFPSFLSFLPSKMSVAIENFPIINLMDDPVMAAMDRHELSWYELSEMWLAANPTEPKEEVVFITGVDYSDAEVLSGWVMPSINLRKHIWENFPVSLLPVNSTDGTERYSVVWHRKNFDEWRNTKPETYDEHADYDIFCERRLELTLAAHSHRYAVEPARHRDEICVIAMVHSEAAERPAKPAVAAESVAERPERTTGPRVNLNNINTLFPVNYKRDGQRVDFEWHNKKLAATGVSKAVMLNNFLEALNSSNSWTFVQPKAGFVAAIILK